MTLKVAQKWGADISPADLEPRPRKSLQEDMASQQTQDPKDAKQYHTSQPVKEEQQGDGLAPDGARRVEHLKDLDSE